MNLNDFQITAVFLEAEEGGFSAYIEEIPGVNTQGETLEEAQYNLEEALKLIMETNRILSQKNACYLLREGSNHSVFYNPINSKITTIPRHNEIKKFIAKKICKDLEIKPLQTN